MLHFTEMEGTFMQISNSKLLPWLKSRLTRVLFTCKHTDACSFPPPFIFYLLLFKLCVVSRCPSNGDKENERGLDIISIEMSLLSMPLPRHSHSAAPATALPFQLANDSVTKCYPSINQVEGVMNIQKAKRRLAASRSSTWPNYTGSAFSCELPLFVSV